MPTIARIAVVSVVIAAVGRLHAAPASAPAKPAKKPVAKPAPLVTQPLFGNDPPPATEGPVSLSDCTLSEHGSAALTTRITARCMSRPLVTGNIATAVQVDKSGKVTGFRVTGGSYPQVRDTRFWPRRCVEDAVRAHSAARGDLEQDDGFTCRVNLTGAAPTPAPPGPGTIGRGAGTR